MLRKQPEIPTEAAEAFVRDMRAYFEAKTQFDRDEIAGRQAEALRSFQRSWEKKVKIPDVKRMFERLKVHA